MKKLISKTTSFLSFVIALVMSGISLESIANDNKSLFQTTSNGTAVLLVGKPPYLRKKINMKRKKNQRPNKSTFAGGHPDVSKRRGR